MSFAHDGDFLDFSTGLLHFICSEAMLKGVSCSNSTLPVLLPSQPPKGGLTEYRGRGARSHNTHHTRYKERPLRVPAVRRQLLKPTRPKPSRDFTHPLWPPSGLKGLLHMLNAIVIPTKAKVKGKWSTLGEPSGKWDYYVKYDAPPETTPIEEIAATGWGDEFSDDEVTPGKVTILEERSDWDDDERSGRKVLVIQERLAQNQQEFLDKYLPQWDEHLAIQKQELESEWENPFAAKHGENYTILHLSKEEENDDLPENDDLLYPKFRNFKQVAAQIIKKHEEHAFPSTLQEESTQSY
ncbi:hypothetical protein Tco_0899391 [Tanacetum coccineum]